MRICTFLTDTRARVGIVTGDRVIDLDAAWRRILNRSGPSSVLHLIEGGDALTREAASVVEAVRQLADADRIVFDLAAVQLLAPIPAPRKNVFAVGRNYKLHIEEGARARSATPSFSAVPEFFTKPPTAVVGPDSDIRLDPGTTSKLDHEVELAFVIGTRCRDVPAARADEVIFGYTIVNDISARDLQFAHGQWFKGKALDTFCPIGPVIVTADEFGVAAGHALQLTVNDELRQSSNTADMLFDCATIVESLSAGMTLEPGDIVTTGTPSGVTLGMSPQAWLKQGDVVECEIAGIERLRNTVRAI